MLHKPNHDVRTQAFCGPTAMSAITGLPISLIRDAVREVSGLIETASGAAHPIMGMRNAWLTDAMALLGWRVIESEEYRQPHIRRNYQSPMSPPRLGDFCAERGNDGPFIVNVTGHYVAVGFGEICDTFTSIPIDISGYNRRMGRWVLRWWKFAA